MKQSEIRPNIAIKALLGLVLVFSFHLTAFSQTRTASIEQAATLYALGSLDAAEAELRLFIESRPNDARRNEAIQLLAEVRIEKERARLAATGKEHSGAAAVVTSDAAPVGASPRVLDPAILSAPLVSAPLRWERSFPGEPSQFRKDGVYAVAASAEGTKASIRIFYSGNGQVAQQRAGNSLIIDIAGIVDALPRGGLDFPSGGATRIRHSQHSNEPLVARIVIDLKNANVKATVTPGNEEIVIVIEEPTVEQAEGLPQGGLYRTPVTTGSQRIEIAGGNFQRGLVADPLPEALAAKVTELVSGAPMANVVVDFYAPDAGITISPRSSVTGPDGIAVSRVTLDEISGRKIVMARLPGTPAEASFELYALARPPDTIRKVDGPDVRVLTRQTSASPLVAVVQDKFGNPIPGVEVVWSFIKGNGRIDASPETPGEQNKTESDKDGRATLRQWTTGPIAGEQRIQASFSTGEVTKVVQFSLDVAPQLVSMDFFQTPVPDILRFLGRIANWNLIISDGVANIPEANANITVHFENVPIDDALDKILAMKKLTRIEQPDGSIKITTLAEAQTQGQEVITNPDQLELLPQDMVKTVIFPVRPRSMSALMTALTSLLSPDAKVVSDAVSGQVVITDFVSNIRRVREILKKLEGGFETRLFRLSHLDPTALSQYLVSVLGSEEKIFPGENSIVFVGSTGSAEELTSLLAQLDRPENAGILSLAAQEGVKALTRVFTLRFAKATTIAPILTSIFQQSELQVTVSGSASRATPTVPAAAGTPAAVTVPGGVATTTRSIVQKILVVAEERTNKLLVTAPQDLMPSIAAVIEELDTVVSSLSPFIVRAQGTDIAQLQQMIKDLYPGTRMFVDVPSGQIVLFVDPHFDSQPIVAIIEALRAVSPASSVRPLVVDATGIDPTVLQSMISALYPGTKLFIDPKLGRAILFVPLDFDEAQLRDLIASILAQEKGVGDTVSIRRLKFANAAALAEVIKNLQTQALTPGVATQARSTASEVVYDQFGDAIGGTTPTPAVPVVRAADLTGITSSRINRLKVVTVAWINSLILIGPEDVVSSINDMVDAIDQRTGAWDVVPIKNADAVDVAPILQQIFPTARFLPEKSSNSLFIVVNDQSETIEIKKAIDYLDQSRGTGVDDTTVVLQLTRADANEVTQILLQIFSNAAINRQGLSVGTGGNAAVANDFFNYLREQDRKADRQNLFRIFPVTSKNLLVIQAPNAIAEEALKIIAQIESAAPFSDPTAGQYVKVYHLEHLLPSQLIVLITSTIDEDRQELTIVTDATTGREIRSLRRVTLVRSVAEDSLKSLIAFATTKEHVQIEELIRQFDNETFAQQRELQFLSVPVKNSDPALLGKWIRDNILNRDGRSGEMIFIAAEDSRVLLWVYAATKERLNRILPILDRKEFSFTPYRIFKASTITSANLGAMITTLYPALTGQAIIVEANAVVTFADQATLDEIQSLINDLDKGKVRYFNLTNAIPATVVTSLQEIFPSVVFIPSDPNQIIYVRAASEAVMAEIAEAIAALDGTDVDMFEIMRTDDDAVDEILSVAFPSLEVEWQHQGPSHTHMILRGPRRLIEEAKVLIRRLENIDAHLVRLTYRTPQEMQTLITTIYQDLSTGLFTIEPLNAIGFIATPAKKELVMELISRFDTAGRVVTYRPRYLPVATIASLLDGFVPRVTATQVTGRDGSDAIVLQGSSPQIQEVLDLLRTIDVDQPVRFLKSTRMPPSDAATLIAKYYPNLVVEAVANRDASGAASSMGGVVVAMGPIETLSAAERLLAEIEGGAIDRPFVVVPIGSATLTDVVSVAQSLFPEAAITTVSGINSILVRADSNIIRRIEEFIRSIDRKVFTAIRPLRYYDPVTGGERSNLITTLNNYLSTTGKIFFDDQSNALIITDALDRVEQILKVIDDMDRPPPQFIIEAVIAEVTITDNKNLGFNWQFRPDLDDFGLLPRVSPTAPAAGGSDFNFNNATSGDGQFRLGMASNNLQVTIQALLSSGDARVVATPKIVTRNNVKGVVNLRQSLPVTNTTTTQTATTTTTTFQEVPILLSVTPSSTWSSDAVRLTVAADISVAGQQTASGAAAVRSRIVNTTVDMRDGQTLIIGGLMQKTKDEIVSKIPFLGDLPGIGNLFRSTTDQEVNTEVLIFLSPRIVYPQSHDLQMEEEINRFKYLVNFPVDWSGRRWLTNNQRRNVSLRDEMRDTSNFVVQPPAVPGMKAQIAPQMPAIVQPVAQAPAPILYQPPPVAPPPAAEPFLGGVIATYDVNTITASELRLLPGMPAHVAQLIVAYRNANGLFASLNDLLNVPGMTVDILEGIRKYLRVSAAASPMSPVPAPPAPVVPQQPTYAPSTGMRININTAAVSDLMTLPGISEANARMILAYRNTYGRFSTTAQLIDVPGITPEMYAAIRNHVSIDDAAGAASQPQFTPAPPAQPPPSAMRININTATEAQLATISDFSTQNVKLIIAYRRQYGPFGSIGDLLNVPSITPELLARVRDRLTVDGSEPQAAMRINLNTATEAQLGTITEFTAQNIKLIIAYRNSYGPFRSVDELLDVPSITQETFDRVRNKLTVQ